jgi:hypoxanthine phosphoribosyltransferase
VTAKTYISAQQLLDDSFELGLKIMESQFTPTLVVGVWRGGTPIAIAMQELLTYLGVTCDHIAIKTASYSGIAEREDTIKVDGLDYLFKHCQANDRILLVDDVFDTGLSLAQVMTELKAGFDGQLPDIRIATPYFKPANNQTIRTPDFYLHETSDWLVFPHELVGMKACEMLEHKPGIERIRKILQQNL